MWGNLGALDLTKLGDSLGEALQKAKDDMEKSIDTTLGIGKHHGAEGAAQPGGNGQDASGSAVPAEVERSTEGASTTGAPDGGAAPPSGKVVTKKIVKKVVRKVVPKGEVSKAGDGPSSGTTPQKTLEPVDSLASLASKAEAADEGQESVHGGDAAAREAGTSQRHLQPPSSNMDVVDASGACLGAAVHGSVSSLPPVESLESPDFGRSSSAASLPAAHVAAGVNGTAHHPAADGADSAAAARASHAAPAEPASSTGGGAGAGGADPVTTFSVADSSTILTDPSGLDPHELQQLVLELQAGITARDSQLIKQAHQLADMQQCTAELQERNEQLALRSAALSEADFESVRAEFEQRLGAAERKVYALTKERDALRKGAEKLTDYTNLIKEKDDIIKQVMDEGEKLSRKQVDLESIIKKVRAQLAATEAERDRLSSRLASEEAAAGELRKAKVKLEKDLVAAAEQAKADHDAQKEHFELLLQKAKSDQVDAEERARDAASQGLARRVREAEARAEMLNESCSELRDALDRQRQAADLREEMLKADLADLERRCQAAELRHQDLISKLPEATRPLLRQIEAMQAAAEAQAEAWAGAEAALHARVGDAEARAASSAEKERLATDRVQALSAKVAALDGGLAASRAEVRSLNEQLEGAKVGAGQAKEAAAVATQQAELLQERCRILQQQLAQLEGTLAEVQEAERVARQMAEHDVAAVRREYERRLADLEAELAVARNSPESRGPEPPAMAAPGYRWVLVKEGEQHHAGAGQGDMAQRSSMPGRRPSEGASLGMAGGTSGGDLLSNLAAASGAPHQGGGQMGPSAQVANELEGLRAALRQKTGELAAMEQHVKELQATRDRLAEELVANAAQGEQAAEVLARAQRMENEMEEMRKRYSAAIELVGERDEALEELRADLMDVKELYKDQIEFMCQQLAELQAMRHAGAAISAAHAHHNHGVGALPSIATAVAGPAAAIDAGSLHAGPAAGPGAGGGSGL